MTSEQNKIDFPPKNYNPCKHPYSLDNELNLDANLFKLITKCYSFAAEKHKHQRRKADNSSYIIHPAGVAEKLTHIGKINNFEIICAAILHDTIEDTDCNAQEIANEFGPSIASYVMEVSDDKSMDKIERKKHQISHCIELSYGAKNIKLADKLDNLTDLVKQPPKLWCPKRCQGYFLWAKTIVNKIRTANENLASEIDKLIDGDKNVKGTFYHSGKYYNCIDPDMSLQDYYDILSKSQDYELENKK